MALIFCMIAITLLPHLAWWAENELEQLYGDKHGVWSVTILLNIIAFFFLYGFSVGIPTYGAEYLVVRFIFFAPYWSWDKYGHIYYLGGGKWNDIERWMGDDVRMWLRFFLLLLYVWYIWCRFAVL